MIAASVLDALLAAGATAEMIVAAVKADAAIEQQAIDARRAKDAERQRRHRSSRDVTVTDCDSTDAPCPPTPPLKVSPDPFKITPPIPPKPTIEMRARRLPDDWKPLPLTGKAAAMVERWQAGEVEREIAKFRNYWMGKAGKDACKTDWQRTFINWLISADERKPRNGHGSHQSPGIGRTEQAAIAALAGIEGRGPRSSYSG